MNNPIIESIEHLKKLASIGALDCYIKLNGGARSSKVIEYTPLDDSWYIVNEIDGSTWDYDSTFDFIDNESIIMEAIDKNALICY